MKAIYRKVAVVKGRKNEETFPNKKSFFSFPLKYRTREKPKAKESRRTHDSAQRGWSRSRTLLINWYRFEVEDNYNFYKSDAFELYAFGKSCSRIYVYWERIYDADHEMPSLWFQVWDFVLFCFGRAIKFVREVWWLKAVSLHVDFFIVWLHFQRALRQSFHDSFLLEKQLEGMFI